MYEGMMYSEMTHKVNPKYFIILGKSNYSHCVKPLFGIQYSSYLKREV